jgi:hypothetical protein
VALWTVNCERAHTARSLAQARDAEEEAKASLERARKAEEKAKANLKQAEANLKLARQAVEECFNVARDDPLFQEPRMEKARKRLLEKTLPVYKQLRSQHSVASPPEP